MAAAGAVVIDGFIHAAAGPVPVLASAAMIASAAEMLVRLHRARGEERAQLEWFV